MTPAGGYTVRELAWDKAGRLPTATPLTAHATYEAAHADAMKRDVEVWTRPKFNPFAYGGALFYLSSLPADQLRDWLLDHAIDPPAGHAWDEWYAAARPDPVLLREALDKLRFFDVVPAGGVAYLAVESADPHHTVLDSPDRHVMAGRYLQASASEARAEERCVPFNLSAHRTAQAYDRYYEPDRAEVVAVPLVERPSTGSPAYVVQRQALDGAGSAIAGDIYDDNWNLTGSGDIGARVPLALFAARAAADAHAADLHAAARRTMNPFARLGPPANSAEFADALHGTGVAFAYPSPLTYFHSWAAWYDAEQATLTDADRAAVWGLFTDRPLYEVVEVEWTAAPPAEVTG